MSVQTSVSPDMDLSGNKLTFSSEQLKDFKQLLLFVTFLFPSRKEWNQNLNRTNWPVSIDISQSVIKNNYTTIQYLNKVKTADTKLDINRCFSLLGNRNFTRWWCPCCPSNHQLLLGKMVPHVKTCPSSHQIFFQTFQFAEVAPSQRT